MLPELERMPRLGLAITPTPLQETPRLAAALGLDRLLVKRDDNTGLALGGNKARKLEYLVAEATRAGADILLTVGSPQSYNCRCTSVATLSGLTLGLALAGSDVQVAGVSISNAVPDRVARTREIMVESCEHLDVALPDAAPVIWGGYVGSGYGMPTELSTRALETAARTE